MWPGVVPADDPTLFTDQSAAGRLKCNFVLARDQYDRDVLVERLHSALEEKREANKLRGILSQLGFGKCGGPTSTLEMLTLATRKKVIKLVKEARDNGVARRKTAVAIAKHVKKTVDHKRVHPPHCQ